MSIDPKALSTREVYQLLIGAVAPRPIALVSTVDVEGVPNLAPYSFFNAFSSNPPIVVFSSNRRAQNDGKKDTLRNVEQTRSCVINLVSYDMLHQMAVTAVEFDYGTSEFDQSGFTALPSEVVAAARVAESPVSMECQVQQIIPLGTEGGAGNLVVCEVVRFHVKSEILNERGRIVPDKIDLVGRLGRAYYCRASGAAVKTVVQPITKAVVGYQALPESVRNSEVLSANNLGQLAGLTQIPSRAECLQLLENPEIRALAESENLLEQLHQFAKNVLNDDTQRTFGAQVVWLAIYLQED